MDKNTKKLLSINEAAEYLGVKPNTIAVWLSTKRYPLKSVKLGRLRKFRQEDLDEFIAQAMEDTCNDCNVIMSEMVSELAEKFMEGARKSGYLQMEEDTLSTFPLDCLPKDLQAYVLELQRAEQIPVDFSAPLMLSAIAASCFRKTSVKVVPNLVTSLKRA